MCTKELVSIASAQLAPDKTLSSFTNFLPEQLNLEGQCKVSNTELSYPSLHKNVTEGNVVFSDKKLSKSSNFYYMEPGLDPSITDTVEAMNTLIQERHNHSENCLVVKMSRRTQNVQIHLANEGSALAFISTDLRHIFGIIVGIEFGVMLRGKRPHKLEFPYNIVRIHSLIIYNHLIEYNIFGDGQVPLLRCFLFISKLKSGDIITTGQYMNYQTFGNLQFRPLLKNSFHIIHTELRDTSGEKIPNVSAGITRPVLIFREASNIHFLPKRRHKMVASKQVEFPFYRGVGRQRGQGFGALAQVIGRTAIPFLRKYVVPASKRIGADMLEFAAPEFGEVISGS